MVGPTPARLFTSSANRQMNLFHGYLSSSTILGLDHHMDGSLLLFLGRLGFRTRAYPALLDTRISAQPLPAAPAMLRGTSLLPATSSSTSSHCSSLRASPRGRCRRGSGKEHCKIWQKLHISVPKTAIGGVSSSRADDDAHQGGRLTPPACSIVVTLLPPFTGCGAEPRPPLLRACWEPACVTSNARRPS